MGRKLVRIFKWVLLRRRRSESSKTKPLFSLCNWYRRLRLCFSGSSRGYIRLGHDPIKSKSEGVPKGHMAVYVGGEDDGPRYRVVLPVMYFNHPLFGELLTETEKEYGFNHSGGITIPCPISDFVNVQMRIAAGDNCRIRNIRRQYCPQLR